MKVPKNRKKLQSKRRPRSAKFISYGIVILLWLKLLTEFGKTRNLFPEAYLAFGLVIFVFLSIIYCSKNRKFRKIILIINFGLVTFPLIKIANSVVINFLLYCAIYQFGILVDRILNLKLLFITKLVVGTAIVVNLCYILSFINFFNKMSLLAILILLFCFEIIHFRKKIIQLFNNKHLYFKEKLDNLPQKLTKLEIILVALIASFVTLAIYYAALPDLMFDSVSFKGWIASYFAFNQSLEIPLAAPWAGVAGCYSVLLSVTSMFGSEIYGGLLQIAFFVSFVFSTVRIKIKLQNDRTVILITSFLILSSPMFFWEFASAYDDIFLGIIAATLTLFLFIEELESKHFFAIGIILGLSILAKLHLFPLTFSIVIILFIKYQFGKKQNNFINLMKTSLQLMSGLIMCIFFPLLHKFRQTGNPFFPILNPIFKSPYFEISGSLQMGNPYGFGENKNILETIYFLVIHPENYGGKGIPFSSLIILVLILWGLALLLLIVIKNPSFINLTFAVLMFMTLMFWVKTSMNIRYLIPLSLTLPIAVASLSNANTKTPHWQRINLCLIYIFVFLPQILLYFTEFHPQFPANYYSKRISPQEFRALNDDGFKPLNWINSNAPRGSNIGGINIYQRSYLRRDLLLSFGWEITTKYQDFDKLNYFIVRKSELVPNFGSEDFRGDLIELVQHTGIKVYSDSKYEIFKLK